MDSRVRTLYKIDARREGPAQARRIIAEELSARLSAQELDDVKLMVSELVTNGIVHGNQENSIGEGDIPVMLDLCVNGDIRCAVLDDGPGFAARVREHDSGGWGLRLVEQLSDRWGMQVSPRRTEVWFERNCG